MAKQFTSNLIAGILSSIVFLLLYMVLDWSLLVSLLIAMGVFIGIYFIIRPVAKIGDIELTQLANGVELNNIYLEASTHVFHIEEAGQQIKNPELKQKSLELASMGSDILAYLENHPKEISKSRHFLTYYLPTAHKIIENYMHLKKANVSAGKFDLITDRTGESLDLLQKVFANQRDGYHKDKLVELEVQTELLEKTITLGGDEIWKEDSGEF